MKKAVAIAASRMITIQANLVFHKKIKEKLHLSSWFKTLLKLMIEP